MVSLPVAGLTTHTRKVQNLYKRALRNLESWYDKRHEYRYHAVLMRERFDENRCVSDMRVANNLLKAGEEELFRNQHYIPRKFTESPGGVAYNREVIARDWILDYWHPLEKAEYPEYFARREMRKKEFMEQWEKKYGHIQNKEHH